MNLFFTSSSLIFLQLSVYILLMISYKDEQEEIYRRTLERERENALKKRKGKKISAAHQHLATSTGLSGQVVALMGKMESSDSDHDSRDARHKKKKKRKKSDRDKKDKKSKKRRKSEKRSKKHKSSRSSSKYHSDSSEDSYSSCSLKEDNNHSK